MNLIPSVAAADEPELGEIEALTELEQREIEHEFSHYPFKQAATIEALKIVQKYNGWVSDGKVKAIAELLGVSADEVDGVATFYNKIYRKPVGEKVLAICDSVSCWIMGAEKIIEHTCGRLNVKPGGTSSDGRFTVLPTPCLGACDKGPVMMDGEELVTNLTPGKIDEVLK